MKWIRNPTTDLGLPHHIQTLGIEDAELRDVRSRDLFSSDGTPLEDEYGILLVERVQIRAHLWVLGAYEVIRMLSERVRKNPELTEQAAIDNIHRTKRLFERVRIPIAKFEPSRKHKATDYPVATAGIGPKGVGWEVSKNTRIYQTELSDAFFQMMASIKPPSEPNKGFNRTPESSGPAKPGEFGGGAG